MIHSGVAAKLEPGSSYDLTINENSCAYTLLGTPNGLIGTQVSATPIYTQDSQNNKAYGLRYSINIPKGDNYLEQNSKDLNGYYYTIEVKKGSRFGETVVEETYVPSTGQITLINGDPSVSVDFDTLGDGENIADATGYVYIIKKYKVLALDTQGDGVTDKFMDDEKARCAQKKEIGVVIPEGLASKVDESSGEITNPTSNNSGSRTCDQTDSTTVPGLSNGTVGLSWDANAATDDPAGYYYINYDLNLDNAYLFDPLYNIQASYIVTATDQNGNEVYRSEEIKSTQNNSGVFEINPTTSNSQNSYVLSVEEIVRNTESGGILVSDSTSCVSDPIAVASLEDENNPGGEVEVNPDNNGSGGSLVGGNVKATPPPEVPETKIKELVSKIYMVVLPIAIIIAVIKILIALVGLATSSGDPQKLGQAKEEILASLLGLLVIVGAVTIINVLGSALGV